MKTIILLSFSALTLIVAGCTGGTKTESDASETKEDSLAEGNNTHDSSQDTVFKILPLGDSRVEGDRPDDESYRFELWKLLLDNEIVFDFVGRRKDMAEYPAYNGNSFDRDHEGISGATTTSLLREIDAILNEVESDIVLLGIGGNDLDGGGGSVSSTIENINILIDKLQSKNKNVVIIIEQIAPARSTYMTPERTAVLKEFNNSILDLAQNQTTITSLVIPVNMFQDWKDENLADIVHYSEEGAKEVALRYFKTLDSIFPSIEIP